MKSIGRIHLASRLSGIKGLAWGVVWGLALGLWSFFSVPANGAMPIPAPEKLVPEDTVVLVTAPDFGKLRDVYRRLPQSQLWNDPAMKPFKDKFLAKWKEEVVRPLERELDARLEDYLNLPQGQLTFALTRNAAPGKDDSPPGLLVLLDAKDKSNQLKTNLTALRKKWVDSGKAMKTEKIRDYKFSVLTMSGNDVPAALRKLFPSRPEPQEPAGEGEPRKRAAKSELVIGQAESLLIVGNSTKVVERIVVRLTGGSAPTLGELAAYQANHLALFRDAPCYGWMNMKAMMEGLSGKEVEKKENDAPDPPLAPRPEKLLAATGLAGLKTIAFDFRNSDEGTLFELFLGAPEATRQGILKLLVGEAKEHRPPAFVPADAVKFQRWRLDGQKAWAALEKMLGDVSPQFLATLNSILDLANANTKQKDPGFDIRRDLIGNLGDDMISYEKAPRGGPGAEGEAASLFLLGSPNAEQLAESLKCIFAVASAEGGAPAEREFLGRKIFSVPRPNVPLGLGNASKGGSRPKLNYAASSGYVAMSTDPALLEEFLRSSESQGKTLRETPGLVEAAQMVAGSGSSLFGYENQSETMRAELEALKKDGGAAANAALTSPLNGALGVPTPQVNFKEWMDFSLLPTYEKVAKYFYFTVYGGGATVEGLTLKLFAPTPPGLKGTQNSSTK